MNFLQQIGEALTKPRYVGYNGRAGGWGQTGFHRGGFDYRKEAGPLYESSIPLMCLKAEQRMTIDCEIVVQKRDENGDWKEVVAHPLLDLFASFNDDFDIHRLLDAVRFDYHLSGNAYVWKSRSRAGRVVGLQWIPSWMIEPRWEENGAAFISCYEYRVDGVSYALPKTDVVHIRNGIDPRSHGRKGLSDFAAILREICVDNEASVYTAAMLRNMGVPGVIISPKGTEANTPEFTIEQRNIFKRLWKENFTGAGRGEPFIQSIPVEITSPGYSPADMVVDKLRAVPEQRICGAFGLPASVLQLGTGLENSNTKAGKGDDREQAYESCVIPTLMVIARQLTLSLISEFDDPRQTRVWFDLSNVRCLQTDENEEIKTLVLACGGPFMSVNEARSRRNLKDKDGGDELRNAAPDAATSGDNPTNGNNNDDDPEPPTGGDGPKSELKAKDANGQEHAPAGSPEGGQFPKGDGVGSAASNSTSADTGGTDLHTLNTHEKAAIEELKLLVNDKTEHGIVINRDTGEELGRGESEDDSHLSIEADIEGVAAVSNVHTHTDIYPPSDNDWQSLADHSNLVKQVALALDGEVYSLSKGDSLDLKEGTSEVKEQFLRYLGDEFKKSIADFGEVDPKTFEISDEEYQQILMRVNKSMSEKFGVKFDVEKS